MIVTLGSQLGSFIVAVVGKLVLEQWEARLTMETHSICGLQ